MAAARRLVKQKIAYKKIEPTTKLGGDKQKNPLGQWGSANMKGR